MGKFISVSVGVLLIFLIDFYVFKAVKVATVNLSTNSQKWIAIAYWSITILAVFAVYYYNFGPKYVPGNVSRSYLLIGVFISVTSKLFASLFLFTDDIFRVGRWVINMFKPQEDFDQGRSDFLSKAAVLSLAVPATTMTFGIISGAYDYRVRRKTVAIKNLPSEFDGIRLAQLSDIHSGSFFNKIAVEGGVEMMMAEKPDVFLFTGDLVNYKADEVQDYFPVFKKIKAPLGQFSVLGNHDYGDYVSWPSMQAKKANLDLLKTAHSELGWDLLDNENRTLTVDNNSISIVGVENWGTGRFPKYGDLEKAVQGTEEIPTKILLSHDPSHWDAKVRENHPDIDLMLAGHTHGFQFGVEIGGFKWSPSQYVYKQWADLYTEGDQNLYVNRGFGFIGYPGRIGILPEITIIELKKA